MPRRGCLAWLCRAPLLAVALTLVVASSAAAVQPYGTNDYGGFRNVLPPGTSGLANVTDLAKWEALHQRPPHSSDQLAMYAKLATAAPNILESQIGQFYKDATFGVQSGNVGSVEHPESGSTIIRDSQFGVPHVYGNTRAELMYGIGWATAADRLFFIDVLRHSGRGTLASFAGGANVGMDAGVWASEPYTPQDLQNQINFGLRHSTYGKTIYSDAVNYVAGINGYIAAAKKNPLLMPGEYAALGTPSGPQPFTLQDLVSIATLVGGIFGGGGGAQLNNAVLYESLVKRFGAERFAVPGSPELAGARGAPRRHADHSGFATFLSFNAANDPEAPTTVRGTAFPYQSLSLPTRAERRTIALPDPGSVRYVNHVVGGAVPHAASDTTAYQSQPLLAFPRDMSNALLINAAHSRSGHPLAVMGPQVAYFAPQILMEEDIHGPGIDADGAAFPGTNLYVQLGHGRDYAWSATSAGQNIIDTFAVPLCRDANHYLLHGHCVAMETLTRSESWKPNALVDKTPAGQVTFRTQRTAFGIVVARARIHGRPVAYTNLRSTYMHELDSVTGFYLFNTPAAMRNPQAFFQAAYHVQYTFNWFYADDKHIAYFNSGLNPVRARNTDPLFPSWSSSPWQGYRGAALSTPSSLSERQTPQSAHPQVVDQSYLTSWNNKQAPGYNDGATSQEYSSIFRSQLLDNNINHYLRIRHGKLTLADLINAMGNAGTQDLRGVEVLPYALRVLGHPSDPALAHAVALLRTWVAAGAHRINRLHPGASGSYQQSAAIRIMDAWWPLLIRAEFQPLLGPSVLAGIGSQFAFNDQPGHGTSGAHLGSSWDVGFYGIVQKDLRSSLGLPVRGALNRIYCGQGSLTRCRAALESSLRAAIAQSPQQVYPADRVCKAADQMCSDSIQFRVVGAISQPLIEWINRPTFQQADEILGHGPR